MIDFSQIRLKIKAQNTPLTRFIHHLGMKARFFSLPAPNIIFTPILLLHLFLRNLFQRLLTYFYWKPLFKQYLTHPPKYLDLFNGLPFIVGSPDITIGDYCAINGEIVIFGRMDQEAKPTLSIGNRVTIGYQTQLYISRKIQIGDDCLIADGCILRGYSGHPLDPVARKAKLSDTDAELDIILENNVWLGQGVKVNPGIRIGENSVIATGSIVTKNIPPNVLAAGIPAKVIRHIND